MPKIRGITLKECDHTWSWVMGDNLWQLILSPRPEKRALYRNGVRLLNAAELAAEPIYCPDDGLVWSMGYEHAIGDTQDGGKAA